MAIIEFTLSEIRIKNFLSYKDAKFSDLKNYNVLIGKNNSGKSNLIRVIKFLYENANSNKFDPSFLYDSSEEIDAEIILTFELSKNYRKELLELFYQGNFLFRVFTNNEANEGYLIRNEWNKKEIALAWLVEKGFFNYFKFYINYNKEKKNLFLEKISAIHNEYKQEQPLYIVRKDEHNPKILINNYILNNGQSKTFEQYFTQFSRVEANDLQYLFLYSAVKLSPSNIVNSIAKNPVFSKALLEVLGVFLANIKIIPHDRRFRANFDRNELLETKLSLDGSNFVKYLDMLISDDQKEWVDELNNELKRYFPEIKELTKIINKMDASVLILKEDGLLTRIELDKMGAGILNVAFFLTWVKFLQKGYFLFIEEPELFIFPGLQKKIVRKFLDVSEDIQIFITTHSIHFLSEEESKSSAYSIQKVYNQSTAYKVPKEDFPEIIKDMGSILEEYENEQLIIYNDQLWNKFIQKSLNGEEDHLWDFKRMLDWWNPHCEEKDKKQVQFSEKVGGFANADGGVIIIGITNDKPREIVGVDKTEERGTNINKIIEQRTNIKPTSYILRAITIQTEKNEKKYCLFLFIPQIKETVEVRTLDGTISYPLRVGFEVIKKERIDIENLKQNIFINNFNFVYRIKEFIEN